VCNLIHIASRNSGGIGDLMGITLVRGAERECEESDRALDVEIGIFDQEMRRETRDCPRGTCRIPWKSVLTPGGYSSS